jgi:hypothetical protein
MMKNIAKVMTLEREIPVNWRTFHYGFVSFSSFRQQSNIERQNINFNQKWNWIQPRTRLCIAAYGTNS